MNKYLVGNFEVSTGSTDQIIKRKLAIILPSCYTYFCPINANILYCKAPTKNIIIFNYNGYQEVAKKYRALCKITGNVNFDNMIFASNGKFNRLCFDKLKILLIKRNKYLKKKIHLLEVQIIDSQNILYGYQNTLKRSADINLRRQFFRHEIPQESSRLKYLEKLEARTRNEKKRVSEMLKKLYFL